MTVRTEKFMEIRADQVRLFSRTIRDALRALALGALEEAGWGPVGQDKRVRDVAEFASRRLGREWFDRIDTAFAAVAEGVSLLNANTPGHGSAPWPMDHECRRPTQDDSWGECPTCRHVPERAQVAISAEDVARHSPE